MRQRYKEFAREREREIEGLLLATKHGQRKLVAVKVKAASAFIS